MAFLPFQMLKLHIKSVDKCSKQLYFNNTNVIFFESLRTLLLITHSNENVQMHPFLLKITFAISSKI